MNVTQTQKMPLPVKGSILAIVAAIAAYPQSGSLWAPVLLSEILAFTLPTMAFLCAMAAYLWHRKTLPRDQLACLRLALLCGLALVVSIVLLVATNAPFIGATVARPR